VIWPLRHLTSINLWNCQFYRHGHIYRIYIARFSFLWQLTAKIINTVIWNDFDRLTSSDLDLGSRSSQNLIDWSPDYVQPTFHKDLISRFWVILLIDRQTDRQTERQTDRHRCKHNLLDWGNTYEQRQQKTCHSEWLLVTPTLQLQNKSVSKHNQTAKNIVHNISHIIH